MNEQKRKMEELIGFEVSDLWAVSNNLWDFRSFFTARELPFLRIWFDKRIYFRATEEAAKAIAVEIAGSLWKLSSFPVFGLGVKYCGELPLIELPLPEPVEREKPEACCEPKKSRMKRFIDRWIERTKRQ